MFRSLLLSLAVLLSLIGSGCSMMAPNYSSSMHNVQKLKDTGDYSLRVGEFTTGLEAVNSNPISMRGSKMYSPYGGTYSAYLAEALRQELSLAGKLAPDAVVEISGVLLKNDLDASGINTGTGDIQARFVIRRGDTKVYDEVKSAHLEWESSFAAAVALPRAQAKYTNLVQKLLAELYDDPTFAISVKP